MKINLFLLFLVIVLGSCKKEKIETPNNEPGIEEPDSLITGYNVRWRDLADFDNSNVIALTDSLHPGILRYPGGTLAHRWDWRNGIITEPGNTNDVPHPITDVKKLAEATNSKIIFVLDIINQTVEDQIEMMQMAGVPVEYIEIGNELYADDYEAIFPAGAAYADTVNAWVLVIRQFFPAAEIGAVMIGRTAGNDRKNSWNTEVHENISVNIDAYIYHLYVGETESVDERLGRFYERFLEDTDKKLWITEYGARSQNIDQAIELSEAVDAIADIALNHCLVAGSGNFSKLTEDCNALTEEGKAFVKRYKK